MSGEEYDEHAPASYTFIRGCECGTNGCYNKAVREYHGFCEVCWLNLTPAKRAVLQGREPLVKEIIYSHESPSAAVRAARLLWAAVVTAAVAYLFWRAR